MVEDVLPRESRLAEPAVANVTQVLLVFSAALPGFQPSPATRYLLAAEAAWLPVTVAINKADLVSPEEAAAVVDQVRLLPGRWSCMERWWLAPACLAPPAASSCSPPEQLRRRCPCRSPAGATARWPSAW